MYLRKCRRRRGEKGHKRCVAQPTKAQAILLQMLQLHLPHKMRVHKL